ncbi:MAG: nicotinate-nucleotide--dimethylbenzimidazole phosphoribosyltransferase [Verrucomicrobiota bacterium]|nr:nicotinate-nucleotide--dimethylbenzimidazole phosphoribosyltransferase [Verrucomicrobiota bacterium]
MTTIRLDSVVKSIRAPDTRARAEIQRHLDNLTKPQGSLGRLEELAMRFCLATGAVKPVLKKKRIYCMAGDHGVADDGVSAYPKAVTPQMVRNMLGGGAAINVLARHVGAELVVVDMGVDDPLRGAPGLCRRKVRRGTANMALGPAMSVADATRAIEAGVRLARAAKRQGVHLLGSGDMGIANTTPSTALFSAYLNIPPADIAGRGTGLNDQGIRDKVRVIEQALAANRRALTDPLGTLAALGGFEIAGICGLILGAASVRLPVVVDGFISTAGALAALRLNKAAREHIFFSHLSDERGHEVILKKLGIRPILALNMRLGEGTGAALAMSLIEASVRIYNEMATFHSAGVSEKS